MFIFGVYLGGQSEEECMYETECRHVAVQRDKQDQNLAGSSMSNSSSRYRLH